MTLALYRTYRPGRFADVIGQDHVTAPLMRALASDRTHHAYLFSGPRGCGKTSSARILARSLNCAAGPTAEPCGTCDSCIELAPNGPGSLDVIELDAASNRGIDQARELRERAMYAPASSKYRIYIIDEAHQLTTEAVNALLKLVEEPPAHLKFVFATTEPEKLLGTIRSRTHHYPFRLVPASVLQEHLARVCEQEGVKADPAALALAAKAGAGSVRDALSVLGQLVGGAGPDGITYEDAVTQLGFTSDALLDEVLAALAANEGSRVFEVIDQVVGAGHDPRRFATDLLERLRDLIILQAAPDAAAHGLVAQPAERLEFLRQQATTLGMPALSRAADLVSDGLVALRGATSPRLHLELLAARLLVAASDADPASLAVRMDQLERSIARGAGSAPAAPAPVAATRPAPPPRLSDVAPATSKAKPTPEAAAPVEPTPAPLEAVADSVTAAEPVAEPAAEEAPAVAAEVTLPPTEAPAAGAPAVDMAAIVSLWPNVVQLVQTMNGGGRVASMVAQNAHPTDFDGTNLDLTFINSGPMKTAKDRDIDKLIASAAREVYGREVTVRLQLNPDFVPPTAPAGSGAISPRPVAEGQPIAEPVVDEPSPDDPVTTDGSGVDVVVEAFGGKVIDEYDEKRPRK